MANFSLYSLFVAIIFAIVISASSGLYLGSGGRYSPRRYSGFSLRAYQPPRTSGRIINYGVVSGGSYRPAQYSPGPGIVG